MQKPDLLAKGLAILGTSLVWFPFLATILFTAFFFVNEHQVHVDYLIPAELFPVALLGGALLVWAAMRARSRTRLIGWAVGIAIGSLVGGQVIASVTGLASGRLEPSDWRWALVLASLAAYTLALAVAGVGGILLLRDLIRPRGSSTKSI